MKMNINSSGGGGDGDAYGMWYGEENLHVKSFHLYGLNFFKFYCSCPIRLSGSPST